MFLGRPITFLSLFQGFLFAEGFKVPRSMPRVCSAASGAYQSNHVTSLNQSRPSSCGFSSGSKEGAKGAMPPPSRLVKIGQKKMAAERSGLYFMFLAPPPPSLKFLDPLLSLASYTLPACSQMLSHALIWIYRIQMCLCYQKLEIC